METLILPLEVIDARGMHPDSQLPLQLAPDIGKQLLQQTELGDNETPRDLKAAMWCTHTGLCQRGCTDTSGCAINKENDG